MLPPPVEANAFLERDIINIHAPSSHSRFYIFLRSFLYWNSYNCKRTFYYSMYLLQFTWHSNSVSTWWLFWHILQWDGRLDHPCSFL